MCAVVSKKKAQWIFASINPLPAEILSNLEFKINEFLTRWNSHGALIDSSAEIKHSQFIVIKVPPDSERPSGCSLDSLFGALSDIATEFGVEFVDENMLMYFNGSDFVPCNRLEFKSLVSKGEINLDTLVVDFSKRESLEEDDFIRKARNSWHSRYFESR